MIKGLFETHLFVEDLERSVNFYKNVLGLIACGYNDERRVAFFWIGEPKGAMLGLWEKPKSEIDIRHFAFRCDVDEVLNKSIGFLKERNLQPYNFLKDGKEKPMVFAWMPAVAIYFKDPDGHELEFIAMLEGEGKPELGVISYEEWLQHQ
ncbi:VOC family protein [Pedobacter nanyangensis]|uniref:VOC family protein n=1 Tax=Pedobacter nanyangensis TaxID=1562389 RepID=UPI000DE374FD|nr:VOC family protein [Pedobacter nanyangensis]